MTEVTLRPLRAEDAEACGQIGYDAFRTIASEHNFPPDFPEAEIATAVYKAIASHPRIYGVAAELDGELVGSNFLWEDRLVGGVGPITVKHTTQNSSIGRKLMSAVLDRAAERKLASVRLVQAAYHNRSLSLYTKLGFVAREPLSNIQGSALNLTISGYDVRPATQADVPACAQLCWRIHGHDRTGDLSDAVALGTGRVVEHDGRISGYATTVGFFGHAVGEGNEELKALIGAAETFSGPGFLVPTRNAELLRWCLEHGLRVVQPATLMSRGLYNEPAAPFLPSILY